MSLLVSILRPLPTSVRHLGTYVLANQSAVRSVRLSLDPAMTSMLCARPNRGNVFPPSECNSVNKVLLKAPSYFAPRKIRKGLETR